MFIKNVYETQEHKTVESIEMKNWLANTIQNKKGLFMLNIRQVKLKERGLMGMKKITAYEKKKYKSFRKLL